MLDLRTNWTCERALGTELVRTWGTYCALGPPTPPVLLTRLHLFSRALVPSNRTRFTNFSLSHQVKTPAGLLVCFVHGSFPSRSTVPPTQHWYKIMNGWVHSYFLSCLFGGIGCSRKNKQRSPSARTLISWRGWNSGITVPLHCKWAKSATVAFQDIRRTYHFHLRRYILNNMFK